MVPSRVQDSVSWSLEGLRDIYSLQVFSRRGNLDSEGGNLLNSQQVSDSAGPDPGSPASSWSRAWGLA